MRVRLSTGLKYHLPCRKSPGGGSDWTESATGISSAPLQHRRTILGWSKRVGNRPGKGFVSPFDTCESTLCPVLSSPGQDTVQGVLQIQRERFFFFPRGARSTQDRRQQAQDVSIKGQFWYKKNIFSMVWSSTVSGTQKSCPWRYWSVCTALSNRILLALLWGWLDQVASRCPFRPKLPCECVLRQALSV